MKFLTTHTLLTLFLSWNGFYATNGETIDRSTSSISFDYDRDGIISPAELLQLKSNSESIDIQFFDDQESVHFLKEMEYMEGSIYHWYGVVRDRMDSNLNIMIELDESGNRITGSASIGTKIYSIFTLPTGEVKIQEFDVSSFPSEEDTESRRERMLQYSANESSKPTDVRVLTKRDLQSTDDDGSVIDIMCLYTPEAVCSILGGGKCDATTPVLSKIMEDKCRLSISETNVAYKESGVLTTLNLVYTGLVDSKYKEENDMCSTLQLIRSSDDKIYKNIRDLRETYKADLVTILVDNQQYCGCGDIFNSDPNAAFSIVNHLCSVGYYSVAHEIGHNMGCNHNRANESNLAGSGYSYGYLDPEDDFRTIMSYNCPTKSCPRIQRFSTRMTSTKYEGQVLGSTYHDNVRQINSVRYTIANYRKSKNQAPTTDDEDTSVTESPTTGNTTNEETSNNPPVTPSLSCKWNEVIMQIETEFGQKPSDASWHLESSGIQMIQSELVSSSTTIQVSQHCIESGKCYSFVASDSGKGLNGYTVSVDGKVVGKGTTSGTIDFSIDSTDKTVWMGSWAKQQNCSWLLEKDIRIKNKCNKRWIKDACPNTCDAC